ncbi:hypothetical protein F2P81_018268 [Scophthalmus maximus]|uniref:N-acetyltransferase domain-containing protein n=1 Tax=Scophthalmus maximus TaxID=52904 RepID=A0A6A4S485_SCOMX|nr:hypothetical protein F2P81_018268 [Scophthalmus maximus]
MKTHLRPREPSLALLTALLRRHCLRCMMCFVSWHTLVKMIMPRVNTAICVTVSFSFHFDFLKLGLAAGCRQLNFTVVDWNKSSLDFYFSQGCFDFTDKMGYHVMHCEGEELERLAQP